MRSDARSAFKRVEFLLALMLVSNHVEIEQNVVVQPCPFDALGMHIFARL